MRVIAEGVETEMQLARITELGANETQGFLLGKPTPDPLAFLTASLGAGERTDSPDRPAESLRLEPSES